LILTILDKLPAFDKKIISRKMIPFLALLPLSMPVVGQLVLGENSSLRMTVASGTSSMYLVIKNASPSGITSSGGSIVSDHQRAVVRWNTGKSTVSGFTVPFSTSKGEKISLDFDVTGGGMGDGKLDFATYGTDADNIPLPSGVTQLKNTASGKVNDGTKVIDRFWMVQPIGFTSNPSLMLNFGYTATEQTGGLEAGSSEMKAQYYNATQNTWVGTFGTDNLSGKVSSVSAPGNVPSKYWTLVEKDSTNSIEEKNIAMRAILLYPNPGHGIYTLEGLDEKETVTVYDAYGRKLKEFESTGTKTTLDLSENPSGIYVVGGINFRKKLIQQ